MSSRDDAKILLTGPSRRGWHRLQHAAECLQKYSWRYESKLAPEAKSVASSPALAKGMLVHLALAQFYARMKARQEGKDEEDWCEPEEAVRLVAQAEGVEGHTETAMAAYRHYTSRFGDNDERCYKIVGVEEAHETTISVGAKSYPFTGRIDLLVEDLQGRIFVLDHKTSSRITLTHKQYFAVSGQMLGYRYMAAKKYGHRFSGMMVNLIQVGDVPQVERIDLPRSPNLETRFEQIVVDIEQSIERMQAEQRPFDSWPKAVNEMTCFGRYGACEYLDWCRYGHGATKAGSWRWGVS